MAIGILVLVPLLGASLVDNSIEVVYKLLAVAGAFLVGYFGSIWLSMLVLWSTYRKQIPQVIKKLIGVISGVLLALAVFLWVFGTGDGYGIGSGPGLGGPGKQSDQEPTTPSQAPRLEQSMTPLSEPTAAPTKQQTRARVVVLGGNQVDQQRFFQLEGDERPVDLAEVQARIRQLQIEEEGLDALELIIYADSLAREHPLVKRLEKWAYQQDLQVITQVKDQNRPSS